MNLPISYNDLQIRLEFPVSQGTKSNLSTSDNICAHQKKTGISVFLWKVQGRRREGVSKMWLFGKWLVWRSLESERKKESESLSRVQLFVAYQTSPSMGFSRQEYWSGLPFPSPGDLPHPGIEPGSPALEADPLTSEPPGKPGVGA